MEIEAATLELARRGGLPVPEFEIQDIGKKRALLVRRFDISDHGGRYHMIRMQTLLQAQGYYFLSYIEKMFQQRVAECRDHKNSRNVATRPISRPLSAYANPEKFKASFLDIGLLQRLCQVPVELELQQENLLAMVRGKLAEQFIAQELIAWHDSNLFYWSRDARGSNAEVDYLMVCNGKIYPIEVKSGPGGSLKSLHLMLENYPDCPEGFVFYHGMYKPLSDQKLVFSPLYAVAGIGKD